MPFSPLELRIFELIIELESSISGFDHARIVPSADADTRVVSCKHSVHTESEWPNIERIKIF